MTVLLVNRGITISMSILNKVIRPMIKFDVDTPWDCFHQKVQWALAIRWQFSTLSGLDFDHEHHLPHALLQEKDTYCLPEGNQWIPNAPCWIQSRGNHNALLCIPLPIEWNGILPFQLGLKPGTGLGVWYPMWAIVSTYLSQDLRCVCLKCYGPNVLLLHSSVPVLLYYLPVWGFS